MTCIRHTTQDAFRVRAYSVSFGHLRCATWNTYSSSLTCWRNYCIQSRYAGRRHSKLPPKSIFLPASTTSLCASHRQANWHALLFVICCFHALSDGLWLAGRAESTVKSYSLAPAYPHDSQESKTKDDPSSFLSSSLMNCIHHGYTIP